MSTTKKASAAKTSVKTSVKVVTNKVSTLERATFLSELIAQNKYTQKELSALVNAKFTAHTKSANNTLLVDCKNVLYYKAAKFEKIVIVNKATSVMSFANYTSKAIETMRSKAQSDKETKKAQLEKSLKAEKKAS